MCQCILMVHYLPVTAAAAAAGLFETSTCVPAVEQLCTAC